MAALATEVFEKPFPRRFIGSSGGVNTIAAGASASFAGTNARQVRFAAFITNLDSTVILYVCRSNGTPLLGVPPGGTPISIVSEEDLVLLNPDGSATVSYIWSDQFYDPGVTRPGTLRDVAGLPISGGAGSGSAVSGGHDASAGGAGYGGTSRGSQPR
jgi:hypothetical protein